MPEASTSAKRKLSEDNDTSNSSNSEYSPDAYGSVTSFLSDKHDDQSSPKESPEITVVPIKKTSSRSNLANHFEQEKPKPEDVTPTSPSNVEQETLNSSRKALFADIERRKKEESDSSTADSPDTSKTENPIEPVSPTANKNDSDGVTANSPKENDKFVGMSDSNAKLWWNAFTNDVELTANPTTINYIRHSLGYKVVAKSNNNNSGNVRYETPFYGNEENLNQTEIQDPIDELTNRARFSLLVAKVQKDFGNTFTWLLSTLSKK